MIKTSWKMGSPADASFVSGAEKGKLIEHKEKEMKKKGGPRKGRWCRVTASE